MKVVVCENCGAKYQLEDDDDLDAFECSICTGNLEELEDYQDIGENASNKRRFRRSSNDGSVLVSCINCGLKFRLDGHEDIRAYECVSCDGPLRYVDEHLNEIHGLNSEDDGTVYDSQYLANFSDDADEIIVDHSGDSENEDVIDSVEVEDIAEVNVSDDVTIASDNVEDVSDDVTIASDNVEDVSDDLAIVSDESKLDSISEKEDSAVDEIIGDHSEDSDSEEFDEDEEEVEEPVIKTNIIGEPVDDDLNPLKSGSDEIATSKYDIVDLASDKLECSDDVANDSEITANLSDSDLDSKGSDGADLDDKALTGADLNTKDLAENKESLKKQPSLNKSDNLNDLKVKKESKTNKIPNDKLSLIKYHDKLKEDLKREFLLGMDEEFYSPDSLFKYIKQFVNGFKSLNFGNLVADSNDSLIYSKSQEIEELNWDDWDQDSDYYSIQTYNADLMIIIGAFFSLVTLAYYLINSEIFVLFFILAGVVLLVFGIYQRLTAGDTEARGKIIRERLITLPEDFHIFYFVKTPGYRAGLNHVVVGPTGIFTILSQKYDAKEYKNQKKAAKLSNPSINDDSASIGKYLDDKNTLKLSAGGGNQTRFKVNDGIKFDYDNNIKQKALNLNENLAKLLESNGFNKVYIEPLIGFVNNEVAVINVILTNEDLFLDELLFRIVNGPRRLDNVAVHKISKLVNKYSVQCSQDDY